MKRVVSIALIAATAAMLSACGPSANTGANNAGSGGDSNAKPVPGAPTLDALRALETKAFDAWKNRDGRFFEGFLTEKSFMYDEKGTRLDKAGTVKRIAEHKCEVKSVSFSDEHMTPIGADAAVITMKVTTEGSCEGQKLPSPNIWASVYVRSGTEWKGAYHNEVTIVDPKNLPPPPAKKDAAAKKDDSAAKPAEARKADPATEGLMAVEQAVWEAWMAHDGKKLADLTAKEISFVNIFGAYFTTKADVMKAWTGAECEIKSVSLTDGEGTMLSPTVGILTVKGTADGTCDGQKLVVSVRGTSVYVNDGGAWKWAFGMNRAMMDK